MYGREIKYITAVTKLIHCSRIFGRRQVTVRFMN